MSIRMATRRTSRVYPISLPAELAQKAEGLADRDRRTTSKLFGEAFRSYYAQPARHTTAEIGEYAAMRNPGYTENDGPRLIREVRRDKPGRRGPPRR